MKIIKHIKNAISSVAIVAFQILGPQSKNKIIKKREEAEDNDVSEEDRINFQANAIEYTPTTKAILHQYYKLYDEKSGRKSEDEAYVSGIFGDRYLLSSIQESNMRRNYTVKSKPVKRTK